MSTSAGVFAVARTKRRRFLWCAWWTAAPAREPFRKPDAWSGGARTEEEAKAQAERAAGRPLREIESQWAGAWVRVQAGLPPWVTRAPGPPKPPRRTSPTDPYAILGVPPSATLVEIKRAFRQLALVHHPDKGGTVAAFLRVKRAYDAVIANREKRKAREARPKPPKRPPPRERA